MAANSSIEWTDQTWNPVVGCSKVSPGCAHCYAETMAARLKAMALADIAAGKDPGRKRHYIDAIDDKGRWSGKLLTVPDALTDPLSWRKPRRVFVNSMSDLFHEDVPNEFIAEVFATMYEAQWHTFQILTKRAERLSLLRNPRMPFAMATLLWNRLTPEKAAYVTAGDIERDIFAMWPLPNVWLGVSVERQQEADERIPWLVKTHAAVRFLSCEPLLDRIDLENVAVPDSLQSRPNPHFRFDCLKSNDSHYWDSESHIDWVIVGGESGADSRACRPEWVRSIVRQCQNAEVPVFVKQLGGNVVTRNDMVEDDFNSLNTGWPDPDVEHHIHGYLENYQGADCRIRLRDKKGGDPLEWPADLRVRQFPAAEVAAS